MKKRNKLYIILMIIVSIIILLNYFGLIQEIKIQEQEIGPFKIVYKANIGDYFDIEKKINDISISLKKEGINSTKTFRIYYDNPNKVSRDDLRSEFGVIIDKQDYDKIYELKDKYNIKEIPKELSIVSVFPYKKYFSHQLSAWRIHPQLKEYSEEKRYLNSPIMEVYDINNKQIIYLMEISK